MVTPALIVLLAAAWAPAALAQPTDWSQAGGGLFVAAATPVIPAAAEETSAVAQLPPMDQPYMDAVSVAAARHGLDPKLLHALTLVESGYRAEVVSSAGAAGLTQLMPATARELGVADRFDPSANLAGGADYLARQLLRFGDLKLALAAYNAGPARVARQGGVPDIPETRAYVAKVIDCFLALSAGRSVRTARQCAQGGASE